MFFTSNSTYIYNSCITTLWPGQNRMACHLQCVQLVPQRACHDHETFLSRIRYTGAFQCLVEKARMCTAHSKLRAIRLGIPQEFCLSSSLPKATSHPIIIGWENKNTCLKPPITIRTFFLIYLRSGGFFWFKFVQPVVPHLRQLKLQIRSWTWRPGEPLDLSGPSGPAVRSPKRPPFFSKALLAQSPMAGLNHQSLFLQKLKFFIQRLYSLQHTTRFCLHFFDIVARERIFVDAASRQAEWVRQWFQI